MSLLTSGANSTAKTETLFEGGLQDQTELQMLSKGKDKGKGKGKHLFLRECSSSNSTFSLARRAPM